MRVVWPAVRRSGGAATGLTFLFCTTSFALVLLLGGSRVNTLETRAYLEITTFLDLSGAAIISVVQAMIVATLLVIISRITRSGGAPSFTARSRRSVRTEVIYLGLW